MRFLNPKTDFAFKLIFGSEESVDVLKSFLNALLDLEPPDWIRDVTIIDPYLAPKVKGMKDTYLDVRVKDERGKSYIIEMQVLNFKSMEKRVLFNACKSYANQLSKGHDYHLLNPVVAVTITDFNMFPEIPSIVNTFELRSNEGNLCTEDLKLVFAELPKFKLEEKDLSTTLDRWFYFLKYAEDLRTIPESLSQEPAIVHALEMANKANLSPEELDEQLNREMFIGAYKSHEEYTLGRGEVKGRQEGLAKGRQEGLAKGRQEGLAKGRQEGEAKGRQKGEAKLKKAVERMLSKGQTMDFISAVLDLEAEEVQCIADRLK